MESQLKCNDLRHAGSAEGVQAAVWVRLKLLLPLLPLIYADPEPESNKNMRVLLAKALIPIMASPLVYQHLRYSSAAFCCARPSVGDPFIKGQHTPLACRLGDGESGSGLRAFQQALSQSLLSVWHALVGHAWAPWLLGRQVLFLAPISLCL